MINYIHVLDLPDVPPLTVPAKCTGLFVIQGGGGGGRYEGMRLFLGTYFFFFLHNNFFFKSKLKKVIEKNYRKQLLKNQKKMEKNVSCL